MIKWVSKSIRQVSYQIPYHNYGTVYCISK